MAETATDFHPRQIEFEDIDIILVEGIFLFKPDYRYHFDLRFWVDCTYETALERALDRSQEGLPHAATVRAYETVYFPAQRIHAERDQPRAWAHRIIANDQRISKQLLAEQP